MRSFYVSSFSRIIKHQLHSLVNNSETVGSHKSCLVFYKIELVFFGSPMLFTVCQWLVLRILRAYVRRQLLIHNHKMELTTFDISPPKDYKAAAAARRIREVEEEGVVSKRVAQRW